MVEMFQLLLGSLEWIEREVAIGSTSTAGYYSTMSEVQKRKVHPSGLPVSPKLDKVVFDFLEEERSEG